MFEVYKDNWNPSQPWALRWTGDPKKAHFNMGEFSYRTKKAATEDAEKLNEGHRKGVL